MNQGWGSEWEGGGGHQIPHLAAAMATLHNAVIPGEGLKKKQKKEHHVDHVEAGVLSITAIGLIS